MEIKSAALIYFSPTGTTRKIVHEIADGIGLESPRRIDITSPDIRNSRVSVNDEDIMIIGVPVYEERMPKVVYTFLSDLDMKDKPVVLVAVYGNVGEGFSLNELKTLMEKSGSKVAAAGSFIGEHSFSTKKVPVAKGRPDPGDLDKAAHFGRQIAEKLDKLKATEQTAVEIPKGKLTLMARILPSNSARFFARIRVADPDSCNHCGICVKLCPVSAINEESLEVENGKCIRCFRCVKICPEKARKIVYKKKLLVSAVLRIKGKVRKEPRTYL